MEKVLQAINN